MANIFELFNQKEILNYLQNRQYPELMGQQLFPEVKRQSLEFDMIKGASRTPVVASVHAFDTEAEIGSREATKQALELAFVKRKMQMKEKDIVALERPRDPAEQQYMVGQVYNDTDVLVQGILARAEAMRMEALANGTIKLEENGLNHTIDYQVPSEQKQTLSGTSLWTDEGSDPIGDIERWSDKLDGMASRMLMSKASLSALLRHPDVIGALYGRNSQAVPTRQDLNAFLTQRDMPVIATYDRKYRKQGKNGQYTSHRYFPNNKVALFGDGPLGETIYGPTPEETRLVSNATVDAQNIGNVLAMMYEETKDPVGTWIKAVATMLPSFPAADEVFQATVI